MASETLDNNGIDLDAIEQDVKKSSLGQWLLGNTKLFIGVVVGITIAALAFVWYGKSQEASSVETLSKVYQFKTENFDALVNGKIKSADVIAKFNTLLSNTKTKSALIPVSLELANKIISKDKKLDYAASVLEKTLSAVGKSSGSELISIQLAAIYEDMGKADESISTLESLKKNLPSYLGAYTYFNLGRMYLNQGKKTKAKEQLDYVVKTYKDSEESKLSAVMLEEI